MGISPTLKQLIGQSTKPLTVEIEKSQIRRFAQAIGENNPIHQDEKIAKAHGYRSLVAPPTFAAALDNLKDLLEQTGLNPSVTMHAEEEYEYFRPLCAGDEVVVTHKIADIYDKQAPNGKLIFVVIETRGNDKRGKPYYKGRRVLVELKH